MDTRAWHEWWSANVGSVSPSQAVEQARLEGVDFATYAEDYAAHWPFEEGRPADLVPMMAAIMEKQSSANEGREDLIYCLQCGSYGVYLGNLGRMHHFRCRGCGWTFSIEDGTIPTPTFLAQEE